MEGVVWFSGITRDTSILDIGWVLVVVWLLIAAGLWMLIMSAFGWRGK